MRSRVVLGLIILGFAALVVIPSITTAQFGGGGRRGGRGGFGGGYDSGSIFDRMANGRATIPISEVRTTRRDDLIKFAKDRGITNGQLSRQQFIDFLDQAKKRLTTPSSAPGPTGNSSNSGGPPSGFGFGGKGGFGKGGFNKGDFGKGGFNWPGGGGGGRRPDANAALNPEVLNQYADAEFKRRDRNGDGRLNMDEMSENLRKNVARWDANADKLIDLKEYRAYYTDFIQDRNDPTGSKAVAAIIIMEDELDKKPVVFRAGGQMPDGLPSWFKELDKDTDGQVALWEWRKGGKKLDDFSQWDFNDDGFITPQEAIRKQAELGNLTAKNDSQSGGQRPSFGGFGRRGGQGSFGGSSGQRPSFGGFGNGGFGKGNWGKGGFGKGGFGKRSSGNNP